jgi:hypothetical protein
MRLRNVCALAMAQAGVLAMAQANALGATPVCVFDVDRTLTRPPDSTCTQPCAPSRSHLQPPTPLPSRPRKRSWHADGPTHADSSPSCGSKGTSCRQNQSRRRSVLPFPPVPPIPSASPHLHVRNEHDCSRHCAQAPPLPKARSPSFASPHLRRDCSRHVTSFTPSAPGLIDCAASMPGLRPVWRSGRATCHIGNRDPDLAHPAHICTGTLTGLTPRTSAPGLSQATSPARRATFPAHGPRTRSRRACSAGTQATVGREYPGVPHVSTPRLPLEYPWSTPVSTAPPQCH